MKTPTQKRFLNNPYLLNKYGKIINEKLNLNIIEKVNYFDKIGETHYLPHKHVIRNEKEWKKIRVVHDASCPSRNVGSSLNDILHAGPPLLFDIMWKF